MNSDQLHVVERFTLDPSAMTLKREYTATDPVYYTDQYTGNDTIGVADLPYAPDACSELTFVDFSGDGVAPDANSGGIGPQGAAARRRRPRRLLRQQRPRRRQPRPRKKNPPNGGNSGSGSTDDAHESRVRGLDRCAALRGDTGGNAMRQRSAFLAVVALATAFGAPRKPANARSCRSRTRC